jgi:hypothetical protein
LLTECYVDSRPLKSLSNLYYISVADEQLDGNSDCFNTSVNAEERVYEVG